MSSSAAMMPLLAFVSVGLWTLRVALAARGRRLAGATVAAAEAVVFAVVFSSLVADLGSWDRIAGYAVGVAVGTVVGLMVNDRLNPADVVVEVVVAGDGGELLQAFHSWGWPATAIPGTGVTGPAAVLFLAVRASSTDDVLELVRATAPDAFWTIRPARATHGSWKQSTTPVPAST